MISQIDTLEYHDKLNPCFDESSPSSPKHYLSNGIKYSMKTFQQFNKGIDQIPVTTTWALSGIAEYKGKQELFTKQSPQVLKTLREHAIIESAVSSNRIEGVEVDPSRVKNVKEKRGQASKF
jgi:hypothetical protein